MINRIEDNLANDLHCFTNCHGLGEKSFSLPCLNNTLFFSKIELMINLSSYFNA